MAPRLRIHARFDSPVQESSGLCVTTLAGEERLVVVGDRDLSLGWCPLDPDPGDWALIDLGALPGVPADLAQIESVEDAGDGVVLLLSEDPSLVVQIDLNAGRVAGSWRIETGDDADFARLWNRDANSRGEALLMVAQGHLLVVKEKCPVLVVELGRPDQESLLPPDPWHGSSWRGPSGDVLVPLAWSELEDAPGDVSDAVVIGGAAYVLSDQDSALVELCHTGRGWAAGESHALDKAIEKAEGVAVTADGRVFVAMDRRDGAGAIVEIDPPPAD